jgi:Outer membrane protein beta-barrel family/CarboxypepD_reg-like domain
MNLKSTLSIFFLFLISLNVSNAQDVKKADIIGVIQDETESPLMSASLMLIKAGDSTLVGFSTTELDGTFKIKNVRAGEYLLKTNYLGYVPLYTEVKFADESVIDLGTIRMVPAPEVLGEVEITADYVPIEISNDTVSYNAAAFKTLPNAVVEDLLKKLPGVEVDKEGNITAQGEEVQKVFVDGKEFFGSDPKIATKNLPADAVDKVQVYDKQSEMAEFTGVDDGEREKTINIKLREDKKKGLFGNIEGGYGTNERYSAKASLNRFNKKSQLSFLGLANNVNEQGFSANEFVNFSGGLGNVRRGGGGGSAVPISNGLSDGIAKTLAGGLNYNVEIGNRLDLRTSYFYNGIDNQITQEKFRQDFLNDSLGNSGVIESFTNGFNTTKSDGHRANLIAEFDIDSTQNIELRTTAGFSNGDIFSIDSTNTFNTEKVLTNRNLSDFTSIGNDFSFDGEIYYRKKFEARKGRSFTANASFNTGNNEGTGFLRSISEFLVSGNTRLLNQRQPVEGDNTRWGTRLSYTEPLGKRTFLELNYQYQNNNTISDKKFFDIDSTNEDGIFNPVLSTYFKRDYDFHRGGATVRLNTNKSSLNLGLQYQDAILLGFVNDDETPIRRDFGVLLPSVRFRYEFATARSMRFDYNTSINVPSIQELSPIVDNADPLRIYIGNPDLKEEYVHNTRILFHSFSQFSNTSIFGMLRGVVTKNKIINSSYFDEDLREVTTPVNIDTDWRMTAYGSFSTPLKFIKTRIRLNINSTYNRSQVFINRVINDMDRWNNRFGMSFQSLNSDIVDYSVGASWTYSTTKYSINSNIDQNFFIQNYYADISVNFLKTWSVSSSFDVRFFSGDQFQGNEVIPLWQLSLSKYVFEDRRGEIKFSVFDVLNENKGISRTSNLNYLQEIRSNSLTQYGMLSFIYSIKGFGQSGATDVHIIGQGRRR